MSRAVAVYTDFGQVGSSAVPVAAGDLGALSSIFSLQTTAGQLRTLHKGEVALPDRFARSQHYSIGSTVELATQRGGRQGFTLVGTFKRSSLLVAAVLSVEDAAADFTEQAT